MASPVNPGGPDGHIIPDHESALQFESRKADHIRLSLSERNQAVGLSGLDRIQLIHEALPDIDFSEVSIDTKVLGQKSETPFLVSSMTAGHKDSVRLNQMLANACSDRSWWMGVGSQRRELGDKKAADEWRDIRKSAPKVTLLGNLGLAQLILSDTGEIVRLVDALQAKAMIIHLNALQECMQPEGTPSFRGGLAAIEKLCRELSVPVVVKETGCGFSRATLRRLSDAGIAAVDISGLGGTHWGRIEGDRNAQDEVKREAAITFADWGISTADAMEAAVNLKGRFEIWGSGGVRSGLDAAKLLAFGATMVGAAMPILAAATVGEKELDRKMSVFEYELKTAMFCTGVKDLRLLRKKKVWQWKTK